MTRNYWFGARVLDKNSYSLLGCTVASGFHFDDFELADRTNLLKEFPYHKELITGLTLSYSTLHFPTKIPKHSYMDYLQA